MIKKLAASELLNRLVRQPTVEFAADAGPNFADVIGFHVYADLTLNLPLAAAADGQNANKYLTILEDYAAVGDLCALQVGGRLLEVQGERLHFVLPHEKADETAIRALLRFSIALTQAVYRKIKPIAGEHWNGFAMAADHGRAIIIVSGRDGDDSAISLGNPANTPAKRLAREPAVESGHLAIPTRIVERSQMLSSESSSDPGKKWTALNVNDPPSYLLPLLDVTLLNRIDEAAATINAGAGRRDSRIISFANADYFADTERATVSDPIEVQGFCLRADLDGFTREVERAFGANDDRAIMALVQRFMAIMDLPEHFAKRVQRPIISLPWAGDCATQLVLLKRGETYDIARRFLPPNASLTWNECSQNGDPSTRAIREALGTTKWAVGIAGGDGDEGSLGRILTANIRTSGRQFLVAAGWGVRRSLDAQQARHVNADDTVLHIVDCRALHPDYCQAFGALPDISIFRRATLDALKKARLKQINSAGKQSPQIMPQIRATVIPAARPFCNDG